MSGKRILPKSLTGKEKLADLIDNAFLAYNGARLRRAASSSPKRCSNPT